MKNDSEKYSRLTFILSVVGFVGSLGFYYGVLRKVYSEKDNKQLIENLEKENKQLKSQMGVLIKKVDKCDE